jgi:5-methylcytosine-specific restriction endonuclease McrA
MRRYPPPRPKTWTGRKVTNTRRLIYERDHGVCQECGCVTAFEDFEVDHILERVLGGSDEASNLRLTCRGCNQRK